MKRFLIFMLSVLAMTLMSSCKNSSEIVVGFLIHSTDNPRWQRDIEYLNEHSKANNVIFKLKNAEGDENQQLKQASELLAEGVDVLIVIAANQNTAAGIVREAHGINVPVIAYDRLIMNSDLDYLISFEYEKVGEYMVDYVAEKAPGGKCVVLWGDANDANAIFVKNGIDKSLAALNTSQQMEIVYNGYVDNWNFPNAKHKMDKVLDFYPEKIDAVIACNVPLGLGAAASLKEHGYNPGEVVITGQDVSIGFVYSMLDNEMSMSITKPLKDLAYGAIDLAIDIVRGTNKTEFSKTVFNGRKDVKAKLFLPTVVDKTNFEEKLINTGIFTREQIFSRE